MEYFTFFEARPRRHAKLKAVIIQVNSKPRVKSLKSLSDTQWACRSDAILAVVENLSAIVFALHEVQSCSQIGRVVSEASASGA